MKKEKGFTIYKSSIFYIIALVLFFISSLLNSSWIFISSFGVCFIGWLCGYFERRKSKKEKRDFSLLDSCSVKERINYANKNLDDIEAICYIIGMLDIQIDEAIRIVIFVNNKTAAKIIFNRKDFRDAKLNYRRVISDLLGNSNLN
jgi:hypothetical protein